MHTYMHKYIHTYIHTYIADASDVEYGSPMLACGIRCTRERV